MRKLILLQVAEECNMPGPTTKTNPWADELKKSRRKSSKGISGKAEGDIGKTKQPLTLGETKEMASNTTTEKVRPMLDDTTGSSKKVKCVNAIDKARPPKAKPPSLPPDEESRSMLYQDARSQLRPVARMLSKQMSKVDNADEETPVDRLIRQGSLEQRGLISSLLNELSLILIPLFSWDWMR